MQAVSSYKRLALAELGADSAREGVRLLKELNRRLQSRNLLTATLADIKAAGARLFTEGESQEASRFLSAELRRFYTVALEEGLVAVNPLTGEAHRASPTPAEAAPTPAAAAAAPAEETTAGTARLVAGVIDEGIQAGLTLSPLALPLAEMGGRAGAAERLADALAGRWSRLAVHLRPVLLLARLVVPAAVVILVLVTVFGDSDPMSTGLAEATATGNAIRDLTFLLESRHDESTGIEASSSLEDLGRRVGINVDGAAELFDLQRVVARPPMLYLRHKQSGDLVVLTEELRGSLRDGTWRVRR
jgi:hypothetical protein